MLAGTIDLNGDLRISFTAFDLTSSIFEIGITEMDKLELRIKNDRSRATAPLTREVLRSIFDVKITIEKETSVQ